MIVGFNDTLACILIISNWKWLSRILDITFGF